jgi:predicted DNA-binding ribbon-helix-helix protein
MPKIVNKPLNIVATTRLNKRDYQSLKSLACQDNITITSLFRKVILKYLETQQKIPV